MVAKNLKIILLTHNLKPLKNYNKIQIHILKIHTVTDISVNQVILSTSSTIKKLFNFSPPCTAHMNHSITQTRHSALDLTAVCSKLSYGLPDFTISSDLM